MNHRRLVIGIGALALALACSTSSDDSSGPGASTSVLRNEYEPVGEVPSTGGITQITFYDATTYSLRKTLGTDAEEILAIESGTYKLDLDNKTLTLTPSDGAAQVYPITVFAVSTGSTQLQDYRPQGLLGDVARLILSFIINHQTFHTDSPDPSVATDPDSGGPEPDASVSDASTCTPSALDGGNPPESSGDGVDVSHYQPNIDWATVHKTQNFAYSKATEGTKYKDNTFAKNYQGMKSAGMKRGAYHFFRASKDAVAQADFFAATILAQGFDAGSDLAPMLDVEVTDGVSPAEVVSGVRAFLGAAQKKLGVTLVLYTGPSFWTSTLGNPDLSSNPLWIAHYTKAAKPKIPSHWSSYSIWQFSEHVPVAGIPAAGVDGDRWVSSSVKNPPDAGTPDANGTSSCADAGGTDGGDAGLIPGNCTHDVCVAGERLGQACNSCTMIVCANDPYCCDTLWGPSCFPDVLKYCGKQCP